MSSKLVFTVSDDQTGIRVVRSLQNQGVGEERISVVGKDAGELAQLPDAGEFENDVKPAAQRGALFGGATGLLAGLGAMVIAPGLAIGGAALALAAAGGATFGVLSSSLIGSSVPNSQIREYEDAIARGELLIIVQLDEDQVTSVAHRLRNEFPELEVRGEIEAVPPVI
ncbi:MAG: hypothetical protein HKN42_10145 [Granulosicoccus sp.]|nr:hypothetical protein [Granulosicoccus sp.]